MESINIILFDGSAWQSLLPLTYTRPVCQLRVGITTIFEKWVQAFDVFKEEVSFLTQDYLSVKYPLKTEDANLFINGSVLPNAKLCAAIARLNMEEALVANVNDNSDADNSDASFTDGFTGSGNRKLLAFKTALNDKNAILDQLQKPIKKQILFGDKYLSITYPWDIFRINGDAIKADFGNLATEPIGFEFFNDNNIIGPDQDISVASDEDIVGATFNTTNGPIYIGSGATIMEGAMIRGPFALCDNGVVKMGAKIYSNTTIGPHSKVGGELSNVVIQGYSNKGHDGYLGNSVIGEWCNLGADTNCSNLKNNYSKIKAWSYTEQNYANTGLQFCGLIMGDHSKSGINTMFNTGTVVGFSANIFGGGFPPKHIPSFAWGNTNNFSTYRFEKSIETAQKMMERRKKQLTTIDLDILNYIYKYSAAYRFWEKTQ